MNSKLLLFTFYFIYNLHIKCSEFALITEVVRVNVGLGFLHFDNWGRGCDELLVQCSLQNGKFKDPEAAAEAFAKI